MGLFNVELALILMTIPIVSKSLNLQFFFFLIVSKLSDCMICVTQPISEDLYRYTCCY